MSREIRIPYQPDSGEAYFDAYCGLMLLANHTPRKNVVLPYSKIQSNTKWLSLVWLALAAIAWVEYGCMSLPRLRGFMLVLAILTSLLLAFRILSWFAIKKSYKTLEKHREASNRQAGVLSFGEEGYTDELEDGSVFWILWSEYHSCIMSPRVIMLRSHKGLQIHIPATEEACRRVEAALTTFGKGNTIYHILHAKK